MVFDKHADNRYVRINRAILAAKVALTTTTKLNHQPPQPAPSTKLSRLPHLMPHAQSTQLLHSHINRSRVAVSGWGQGFGLDLTLHSPLLNTIHTQLHFSSEVAKPFSRVPFTLGNNRTAVLQLLARCHHTSSKFSLSHLLLTPHRHIHSRVPALVVEHS